MTTEDVQDVAIVTGAANGIGYAVAEVMSMHGYAVALVDLNKADTKSAAEAIATRSGRETCWCVADVRDLKVQKP